MAFFSNSNISKRLAQLAIGLGVAGSLAQISMYNVEGGQRAVIFNRIQGVENRVIQPGTHFLIPWLQRAIFYDVRTQPKAITTVTGSKDMQIVTLTLRILHRPNIEKLPDIYRKLGPDYDERVLPSIGNEVLKAVVAQFDAHELITQREAVSQQVRESLVRRAKDFNILLDDVAITHLAFSNEFTRAVELKQVAQQDAERARFVVEKAEQERNAAIIRAEGEATAAHLISKALQESGEGLIDLRRIEASKEIAGTLASSPTITWIPSNGQNFLLNLQTPPSSLPNQLFVP
jgi:prohibitin 1